MKAVETRLEAWMYSEVARGLIARPSPQSQPGMQGGWVGFGISL